MINPDSDDQNIPGLDDLLDSIRGESGGNKSGALAVYVPDEREEDLVSEQIDERILTLLGLEDAIDIDYNLQDSSQGEDDGRVGWQTVRCIR